jgi:2-C-methyl-D-erythritol 2,4-cyclodiphosphate synthase
MYRIGNGFDAHRLIEGRPFIVGGVNIPFARGPLGHSDGDVVAHALCDAILGACALGDLGSHFPDSNERWKGADSFVFLAACAQMARDAGYEIGNLDATIVVQEPRVAPYIPRMRERIAHTLGLNISDVSVKAKTSEGMGYTGDGSGIVAYAVSMMRKR